MRYLATLAAALALTSCKCTDEHPYTPFRIPDAPTAPASSAAAPPAASASAGPTDAVLAPKSVNTWLVDDVPVSTSPDRIIDRALAADFDGDGAKDAVAWTRALAEPAESHATGELVFFGGKTPAGRVVAKTPPFVPSGPGCSHTVRLAKTGDKTVSLDVAAHCSAALVARSPTRGVVVIAPGDARPIVLSLRLADAAPGETLSLSVDSHDRDSDGRDDVRLAVALRSEGNDAEAAADLAWVDRAAGASQDRSEPARSLGALTTAIADRAKAKATSKEAPPLIENARRLLATLCAEWGTPRLFDQDGGAISCGDLSAQLESLVASEVRSAIVRKDPLAAIGSLGRDGWYGLALTKKTRRALEKEAIAATSKRPATIRPLDIVARSGAGLPRWSPLAFDSDGSLLVQTKDGVARARTPDGQAEDASESVDAWPLTVGSGADLRWTGIGLPCDRSEVVLLVTDAVGTPQPSKPTRMLAPRPGACRPGAPNLAPWLTPLEWSGLRMIGLIGGTLFGVTQLSDLAPNVVRGTPRSPDGKNLVVAGPTGLLVLGGKAETWIVDDPTSLSECVVANGAAASACLAKGHVVVVTPDPKAAPAK
jgi:hypothetical protein